eukprot:526903-Amphidinium_carterae.3
MMALIAGLLFLQQHQEHNCLSEGWLLKCCDIAKDVCKGLCGLRTICRACLLGRPARKSITTNAFSIAFPRSIRRIGAAFPSLCFLVPYICSFRNSILSCMVKLSQIAGRLKVLTTTKSHST